MALTFCAPVAAAGSLCVALPAQAQTVPAASPRLRGYHSSPHIDRYYSSLRY